MVKKNPPANAGGMGSIPDPVRSHMPQSSWAHAPQILSLCPGAWEPQQEDSPQRESHKPSGVARKRGRKDGRKGKEFSCKGKGLSKFVFYGTSHLLLNISAFISVCVCGRWIGGAFRFKIFSYSVLFI